MFIKWNLPTIVKRVFLNSREFGEVLPPFYMGVAFVNYCKHSETWIIMPFHLVGRYFAFIGYKWNMFRYLYARSMFKEFRELKHENFNLRDEVERLRHKISTLIFLIDEQNSLKDFWTALGVGPCAIKGKHLFCGSINSIVGYIEHNKTKWISPWDKSIKLENLYDAFLDLNKDGSMYLTTINHRYYIHPYIELTYPDSRSAIIKGICRALEIPMPPKPEKECKCGFIHQS